ncbi:hypothetical protein B9G55_03155 [Saccharibacillus sp. O16]|nr:hypothetical protein B9G55_03155 [Saccharibacillus sp. O16]
MRPDQWIGCKIPLQVSEYVKAIKGEMMAVACTDPYNYEMASDYKSIRRPAVVFVKDGQSDLVICRESLEAKSIF